MTVLFISMRDSIMGDRRQLIDPPLGLIHKFVSVNKAPTANFTEFVDFFPLLKPPFNLLPDITQIPSDADPLPAALLDTFIAPFEGEEADEYTEYIPYGRIEGTKDFYALIYWKA